MQKIYLLDIFEEKGLFNQNLPRPFLGCRTHLCIAQPDTYIDLKEENQVILTHVVLSDKS